ncbi:MAG: tryptophan-rich sensory protein [Clostridia bacterium]|nr:tryptophan-rich sensory protein [Clostridia bacterium]
MSGSKSKNVFLFVLLCEAAGLVSGLITRGGAILYAESAVKPFLSPPGVVFPIVWTVLYALMGVGAGLVASTDPGAKRTAALRLFGLQLAVNFFWSVIFFNMRAYGAALLWLFVLLFLVIALFRAYLGTVRTAAYLLIPYLVRVAFAGYLNAGVWILN